MDSSFAATTAKRIELVLGERARVWCISVDLARRDVTCLFRFTRIESR
jgi:hypothetical protein